MTRTLTIALAAGAAALALAGCATLEEGAASATNMTYHANLTGAQEVAGGDPDGSGKASITIADGLGRVCWDLHDITNIGPIMGAHIHQGLRGTDGPVVFELHKSKTGSWKGCGKGPEWLQNRLQTDPSGFYVNVHTAQYPKGAIRGQLMR
ncbi:MAG: CHRD domain-containing protein [Sphingomonadaceae bacterium]